MKKLWFKRKSYGWGWQPATWQGWGILAIYLVLVFCISIRLGDPVTVGRMILEFFVPIFVLTGILIFICYRTGEKPRWQWGSK